MITRLDIAMTPAEALLLPVADCYVVIDALRATTTISALFSGGLASLHVVADLEAGRALRASRPLLLFGEEGGLKPPGFDFGNSPAEAASLDVEGREAALVTSNGTVALCAVASRGVTVAGALVNLSAVADFAGRFESVMAVCAGNGGARRFSLEDFAVAAALIRHLASQAPGARLNDGAILATRLAAPEQLLTLSEHAAVTRSLGFAADLEYASQRDLAPSVPRVTSSGDGWAILENAI
ncbi:MAG: 2-phosphosulfolactate phosphatase [bacterium]